MSDRSRQLGARLRRARLARGLSLQALSERLDPKVSRAALSKYELGAMTPRAPVLVDLGRALDLPPTFFLAEERELEIVWLPAPRTSARAAARLDAAARLAAEGLVELTARLCPGENARFPQPTPAATHEDAERAAEALRAAWGLGTAPLGSLVARVEEAGALVLELEDLGADARAARTSGGFPILALDAALGAEARRAALARELGRLQLDTAQNDPRAATRLVARFAAALRLPRAVVEVELGLRRTWLTRAELEPLARTWTVPLEGWVERARELGIVGEHAWREWRAHDSTDAVRVAESASYATEEKPERMRRLVLRGLSERLVDGAWARRYFPDALAELAPDRTPSSALLRVAPSERRDALRRVAARAAADYATDPEVAELLDTPTDLDEDEP